MTAATRPQHIVDAVDQSIADRRARAVELVAAYRAGLAGTNDGQAAFAGVAAAAYQRFCSREMSQILAAAVQVIAEMQVKVAHLETELAGTRQMLDVSTATEGSKPRRWLDRDGQHWQQRGDGLIALETEAGLSGLFVCTDETNLADEYGPVTEVTR